MSARTEIRLLQKAFRQIFDYYRKGALCLVNRALARESIPQTNLIFVITSGVCNLACRFCHYSKKSEGKEISDNASFARYIEQVGTSGIVGVRLDPLITAMTLEGDQEFARDGLPDTPDAFGGPIANAINWTGVAPVMFTSDGSLIDNAGDVTNGTMFIIRPGFPETGRAVTIWGVTGLLRTWKWRGSGWMQ